MIKYIFFIILFLFPPLTEYVYGQFINLQLKVEAELSATVEQNLNFETQIANSGRTEIQLGDVNMGVFSIRAFRTQNLYINLEYPDALTPTDTQIDAEIPLELNLSYNNSGTNTVSNSTPLPSNKGMVSVHESTQLEFDKELWKQLFIYVYGAIDVGNIPNGIYTGDIVLSVDYD
ncbi:MAG: hypothetical protein MK198_12180 [Gracilimonas sp.]|jgi:large exoprotein involved in heme utilization and adhesion|uniref:hypothetical protein n=1 Tax=Gracilimonas sp. TaxID=1974203 RepID=UPI00375154CB|nr:hypothetical protein [Gracilimonas sp.]